MKHRLVTLVVAFAAAVSGSLLVAAPPAYADGLDNPSGTLTVSCPRAEAFIQVDWKAGDSVTVRWRIEDTGTATDVSPVLRIQAHDFHHTAAAFVFPGDNAYFVLRGGNGTHQVGVKHNWNPGDIGNINHLLVKVQNGTTAQGTSCTRERNIFNWTRIAYKNAVAKKGADYDLGGTGPAYDCSGLVVTSYNSIGNFPGFGSVLKIGDLLFYENTSPDVARTVEHVAFWAGDNTLYDAHAYGVPVGYHDNTTWWSSRLVAAYRVLGVATV